MKSELDILVEELEKEQAFLAAEIDKCVLEQDFLGAYYFGKASGKTREKLRILRRLQHPDLVDVDALESSIDFLKRLYKTAEESQKNYFLNRLLDKESQLAEVKRAKPGFRNDGDEILTALENLISGKIKTFQVILREEPLNCLILNEMV